MQRSGAEYRDEKQREPRLATAENMAYSPGTEGFILPLNH
jgi:hypothetical protein